MIWCAWGPFFVSFFGQTKKEKYSEREAIYSTAPDEINFYQTVMIWNTSKEEKLLRPLEGVFILTKSTK